MSSNHLQAPKDSGLKGQVQVRYSRPEAYATPPEYVEVPPSPNYYRPEFLNDYLEHYQSFWLEPNYLTDFTEAFKKFLGPRYAGSVLDAGCGMGHFKKKLNLTLQQYTGLELNHAFVKAGREYFPGVKLVVAAVENIPFPDNYFDCVICSDVLIHIEDMTAGLHELIRVSKSDVLLRLRSGNGASQVGKIVYDPTRSRLFSRVQVRGTWQYFYYNVLGPEDLSVLLREAGITEYQSLDLLPPNSNELGVTKIFFNVQQAKTTGLL